MKITIHAYSGPALLEEYDGFSFDNDVESISVGTILSINQKKYFVDNVIVSKNGDIALEVHS